MNAESNSSRSSRSVTPVIAECTMSTRAPLAAREAATRAMLPQLAAVDTLVPPNLRTIQDSKTLTLKRSMSTEDAGNAISQLENPTARRLRVILMTSSINRRSWHLGPPPPPQVTTPADIPDSHCRGKRAVVPVRKHLRARGREPRSSVEAIWPGDTRASLHRTSHAQFRRHRVWRR
jgi:hypothetical protein